jgi:hypothetical protein
VIEQVHRFIVPAAYSLLPPEMASDEATAMLLAIGLQESKFRYRQQVNGPARGFWQFERGGGIAGVLRHEVTAPHIRRVLRAQCYAGMSDAPSACHQLVTDNDVIAAVFARLLLWTVPGRLPTRHEPEKGWQQYIAGWRPGKPHRETWDAYFASAWQRVDDAAKAA